MNLARNALNAMWPLFSKPVADLNLVLRMFSGRSWLSALAGAFISLGVIGALGAMFDNPLFTRMTPVRPQDYFFWVSSALLFGLLVGMLALDGSTDSLGRKGWFGVVLADVAIGCPICNKVVVLALGVSGALSFFAPLQFYIGLVSLALLTFAILLRANSVIEGCRLEPLATNS